MLKEGMKIEATHVKKKQLHQYLPPELVQKKKRVGGLTVNVGTNPFGTSWLLNDSSSPFLLFLLQSIAELNRSSNGGSSKRLSLDSSHLDSSRDTDSGTPFSSPTCKPSKPASDTDDRYDTFYLCSPLLPLFCTTNIPASALSVLWSVFCVFLVWALLRSFLWKAPQHPVQHQRLQTRACLSPSLVHVSFPATVTQMV